MNRPTHRPIVILIRDGWGANPYPEWNHVNAVHLAHKPVDDRLMAHFPHALISTHGRDVGLPDGVMGNSEVGHQNIGAGRIVEQEIMRITGRIHDGKFFSNRTLIGAFEHAARTGGRVHLLGLCSDGRVHSDLDHLYGLLELSRRLRFPGQRVAVHAFTDGRDTPPDRGIQFVEAVEEECRKVGAGPIASVIGRYYAMDRDNRWDRIETAYRMLVAGEGRRFASAADALRNYYANPSEPGRAGDEFVLPSLIVRGHAAPCTIRDGDSIIFFNYRGDRPRQLTKAFVCGDFPYQGPNHTSHGFERGRKLDVFFVTMTAYEEGLHVHVAFAKPPAMERILGAYAAECGLRQFRCAETEKYPHVTYFFNDYRDEPFPGEERQIVPSPRGVSTYDQNPEMSAFEVTDVMLARVASGKDDLMVLNYANGDMVGHTGNLQASIRAVEAVDECVGRVCEAVLARGGGLIVTADHGNCEQMTDAENGGPHTAHTPYDVELIIVDDRYHGRRLRSGGRLADVAPTALAMLNLPRPDAMSGTTLLEGN